MYLGNEELPVVNEGIHMGVNISCCKGSSSYVDERINRAYNSFFPMLGITRSGSVPNPVVGSGAYHLTLYGIEIWDATSSDIKSLSRAHVYMAKTLQGLPRNTANAGVLIPSGWSPGDCRFTQT